jgi:Protein of unknown function (DUF3592)
LADEQANGCGYAIIRFMDYTLLGVAVAAVSGVLVAIAAWVVSVRRLRKLAEKAREWPAAEASIQSGGLEGTKTSGRVVLPTFGFSYQVSGKYYGGYFSLRHMDSPLDEADKEALIGRMIGRRIMLRYDPRKPDVWFIPEESIEGCKVEQKLGSHAIFDYSPKD